MAKKSQDKSKSTKVGKSAKVAKPSSPKGPRGSPKAVEDLVFRMVCENHVMGIKDTLKLDLALKAGYVNPRSETFAKAVQAHTKEGVFTRGAEKDSLSLTDKGVERIPKDLKPASRTNREIHDHYISFLEKKAKIGGDKIRSLWGILQDRKVHAIIDIATALGYNNPRSFSNTKIISTMKEIGVAEDSGKGRIVLTDKCFPYKE